MRTFHSFALLAIALLAGFVNQGCSVTLPDEAYMQDPIVITVPPPLLVVESPREGVTYTDADDVDPAPGLQLPLVVRVNDRENKVALDGIAVRVGHDASYISLPIDDGAFGRAARASITVAQAGERLTTVLRVLGKAADLEPISVDVPLTVQAGEAPLCSPMLTLAGDFIIASPADLDALAGETCVVISGDLVVEESALDALSGTEPIVHVSGSVRIERNDALSSIDALANIRFIGGDMIVAENPALPSTAVSALLETIGEDAVQGEIVIDDT
jgi:hypothetical protein